jgi:predicted kinase
MVGYPGSGKTTTARIIQELTGAVHLWADHERNKRFVNPTHSHTENIQLYDELNKEVQRLLHAGKSVIFDTNFNFASDRKRLRAIADAEGARSTVVWVTTDQELAKTRATKQSHGQETRIWGNMSVADFTRIASKLQPPSPGEQALTLDGTTVTVEAVRKTIAAYL